jgi:hypothetical protein
MIAAERKVVLLRFDRNVRFNRVRPIPSGIEFIHFMILALTRAATPGATFQRLLREGGD